MKFFNVQLLKQARKAITRMIEESPEEIIINRKDMVSDGFDGEVTDPFGIEKTYTVKCRLSHEKKYANYTSAPVGLSTNLSRYILVEYDTVIYEDDLFEAIGKSYKIGVVDPLIKFGGTIGYQAPLIEAVQMGGT